MTGFADTWYPQTITAMRSLRGDSSLGTDRVVMPLLRASDGIAMLGQVSPNVVNAIISFERDQASAYGGKVGRSDLLDDGVMERTMVNLATMAGTALPAAEYVAGYGIALNAPYRRWPPKGGDYTWEPFIVDSAIGGNQEGLLTFVRQMMGDWQRAVDSAAAMISAVPNVSNNADPQLVSTFLWHLRALCRDLDVLRENPPQTTAQRIKDAAINAVRDTEEFAGQAAAQIAGAVGEGAGLVARGFFAEAGVTSLIVAGIAVWLFVK